MDDMSAASPASSTKREYQLLIPTKKNFASLCELQDLAFEEKRGCCQPIIDCRTAYHRTYEFYANSFPNKLQHCRIILGSDDSKTVIGACQLQLPGDPGDMSFCADGMRRDVHDGDKQAFVEWIACHPEHTGKGIGTALLQWAVEYCHQKGMQTLSLQVGSSNKRAMQLYQRQGFVTTTQPGDDCIDIYCLGPLYVYCCLGFKHYSLVYMERRLMDAPTANEEDVESKAGSFKDDISDTGDQGASTTKKPAVNGAGTSQEPRDNGMERE
jgi:ribosomal protein S18 acetylase RimI-like enzyme